MYNSRVHVPLLEAEIKNPHNPYMLISVGYSCTLIKIIIKIFFLVFLGSFLVVDILTVHTDSSVFFLGLTISTPSQVAVSNIPINIVHCGCLLFTLGCSILGVIQIK